MKLPEPVAWMSNESKRRLADGGNRKGAVPVHQRKSSISKIPLFTEDQLREALARQEAVMRHVLDVLGPQAPECWGCKAEWNEAIKALEDALK